jgi:hypothetical protein
MFGKNSDLSELINAADASKKLYENKGIRNHMSNITGAITDPKNKVYNSDDTTFNLSNALTKIGTTGNKMLDAAKYVNENHETVENANIAANYVKPKTEVSQKRHFPNQNNNSNNIKHLIKNQPNNVPLYSKNIKRKNVQTGQLFNKNIRLKSMAKDVFINEFSEKFNNCNGDVIKCLKNAQKAAYPETLEIIIEKNNNQIRGGLPKNKNGSMKKRNQNKNQSIKFNHKNTYKKQNRQTKKNIIKKKHSSKTIRKSNQ